MSKQDTHINDIIQSSQLRPYLKDHIGEMSKLATKGQLRSVSLALGLAELLLKEGKSRSDRPARR